MEQTAFSALENSPAIKFAPSRKEGDIAACPRPTAAWKVFPGTLPCSATRTLDRVGPGLCLIEWWREGIEAGAQPHRPTKRCDDPATAERVLGCHQLPSLVFPLLCMQHVCRGCMYNAQRLSSPVPPTPQSTTTHGSQLLRAPEAPCTVPDMLRVGSVPWRLM